MKALLITVILAVLSIHAVASDAPPLFQRLIIIVQDYTERRPVERRDLVREREVAEWAKGLREGELSSHLSRLVAEAASYKQKLIDKEDLVYHIAEGEMLTELFKQAVKIKAKGIIVELLKIGRVGRSTSFERPEHHLVKSAGNEALMCYFDAFDGCNIQQVKKLLAEDIILSLGLLKNEVWSFNDTDEEIVAKLRRWFEAHHSELRVVDVYYPFGSRKIYFDQGMSKTERLIGLFFQKN